MDRAGANFFNVYDQMRSRLKANPVPLQVPVGAAETFTGVIDLVKMKSVIWDEASQGMEFEYGDIPAEQQAECDKWRSNMVETAAEANEELMDKYLENGDLSEEDIIEGLRIRTIASEIVPMMCGSAFKNKGVQAMLDKVIELMPAPTDIPDTRAENDDGEEMFLKAADDEKFAALAFKIMTDPFVGQLIFIRVYSGTLKAGDSG